MILNLKKKTILVSIIIPSYNAARFIENAIMSALTQKVEKEIIVVDDCSTDNTKDVLEKFFLCDEVRIVFNKRNLGVAESRNIGINLAKGKYIAFLDADDIWINNKLEKQIALLESKQGVLCCTGRDLFSESGKLLHKYIGVSKEISYKDLLKHNSIACSSVVLLKDVAKEFMMCHDELHEDYIMWLRILRKYNIVYGIDEPLLKYRLSKSGKSRNKIKSIYMTYGVYRYLGIGILNSVFYLLNHLYRAIKKYYFKSGVKKGL